MAVTRSIFVGPPEAGKSTLKHFLVHNTPKAVKTSTAVMDTPEVVSFSAEQYVMGESTSAWQLVDRHVMREALCACVQNEAYKEKGHYPTQVKANKTEDVQPEAVVVEGKDVPPEKLKTEEWLTTEEDLSDMTLLDKHYFTLLQRMSQLQLSKHRRIRRASARNQIKLTNASFMHLLDTGGQPSFQDVLPLLLDVPCTYIQVFNAALSLDERVPITYRCDDHTKVPLEGAELGREMMLRSFCSMQTMAQKCSKQLASFLHKGSPVPQLRIFVVGTHKDQLIKEGRLDEATQDITTFMKGLEGKPYYRSIQWNSSARQPFFLIDAMGDKDARASANCLRKCLSSEGSPLKLDVPVMWFICQEVTQHTPKKFFGLQDLQAFCRNRGFIDGEDADSQFQALLQLFSLLGFYSFFNLKGVPDKGNIVCTDTGVFLKEVSKLLAVQFTDPTSGPMQDFKNHGVVANTPQLFKDLKMNPEMDPKWFLEALQHLGIAARLPSKERLEYFIPAALPQNSAILDPPASVAPLCLTYKIKDGIYSFTDMPRGVFCRLAVELIRQEWKILKHDNSRSLLKFRWEEHEEFDIFLQDCPGFICIIPQAVHEVSSLSELRTACKSLIRTVEQCLFVSTEDVVGSQFSSHAKLAVGFRCHCKEETVPHLAIPSKKGKDLECTHNESRQEYSNQQRIWFSPVTQVEVSIC